LAEVVEVSIDVTRGEVFERISVLIQIREETMDVPVPILARGRGQPASLALYFVEIVKPRIVAAGRRNRIGSQAAEPLQETASNGVKLFLRPARSGSPSFGYASRCPRSGDGFQIGSIETVVSRPPLDLLGDASAVASMLEQRARGSATILKVFQIFNSFRGERCFTMSSQNSRI